MNNKRVAIERVKTILGIPKILLKMFPNDIVFSAPLDDFPIHP
jgi:hypothetical protein